MRERVWLVLADGEVFTGRGFGHPAPFADSLGKNDYAGIGEVVFNTAMVGYPEVLTDPSYTGQIVAMTYPHIGNYGVNEAWSESGPTGTSHADRRPVKVAGFILRKLYSGPIPAGRQTLHAYLQEHSIPGISDVDTRALTVRLRKQGSINGILVQSGNSFLSESELSAALNCLNTFPSMEGRNLLSAVGSREIVPPSAFSAPAAVSAAAVSASAPAARNNADISLALYDCGIKANIIREFKNISCVPTVYPSTTSVSEILAGNHHALMVSNGPGDPQTLDYQIQTVKKLIGKIPIFGICLGHQIIAEALGAKIYKMKFGHHGINHPVRDERSKKVFVTSQNHGFAVDEGSLPASTEIWFRNANDQSNEGIRNDDLAVLSVQFHPESAPGPYDSRWIFTEFLTAIPMKTS